MNRKERFERLDVSFCLNLNLRICRIEEYSLIKSSGFKSLNDDYFHPLPAISRSLRSVVSYSNHQSPIAY